MDLRDLGCPMIWDVSGCHDFTYIHTCHDLGWIWDVSGIWRDSGFKFDPRNWLCDAFFSPLPSLTILGGPPDKTHIDSATATICRSLS